MAAAFLLLIYNKTIGKYVVVSTCIITFAIAWFNLGRTEEGAGG